MITGAVRFLEQNQKAALFLALIISIFIFRLTTLYYSYNTLTEYLYAKVKTLLEKADIADFDAFILDINVPNFNGLEILEFIRNNDSKTPVVLISSYTDTKDVLTLLS